jgi:F0F1-type ATP synthase epsilon subunit
MAALATGAVEIHGEDENVSVGIHGGFLQIYRNQVTLLTDRAEITEGGRDDALRLAAELRAAEEAETEGA